MMETASYMTSEPSAGRWKYLRPRRGLSAGRGTPPRPSSPASPSPGQLPPSPPEVVEEEGDVEAQGHPLRRTQKHQTEEAMDGIFGDHQLGSEGKRSAAWPWRQDRPRLQGHRGELGFGSGPATRTSHSIPVAEPIKHAPEAEDPRKWGRIGLGAFCPRP